MGKTAGQVDPLDRMNDDWSRGETLETSEPPVSGESATDTDEQAAEIRSDIEHTRAELSQTIDALQEKLDPARIAEQVKDQIRDRASEAYDSAKESIKESIKDATIGRAEKIMENVSDRVSDVTQRAGAAVSDTGSWLGGLVRENPLAFTLIGAGLAALALNSRRTQQSTYRSSYRGSDYRSGYYAGRGPTGYYPENEASESDDWSTRSAYSSGRSRETGTDLSDKAREIADTVTDTARAAKDKVSGAVSSAAASVRETASTVADTTREQMNTLSAEARYRARSAGELLNNTLQDNPLALGVAALAAGALIGLVLPPTRVEGEYMGEARDQFVDKAKAVAKDTAEKVQRVTEEAGRTLKQEAQRETQQSTTPEPAFPVKF